MSVSGARTEVRRCATNIAKGGDPKFWLHRLKARVAYLTSEIAILESGVLTAAAALRIRGRR